MAMTWRRADALLRNLLALALGVALGAASPQVRADVEPAKQIHESGKTGAGGIGIDDGGMSRSPARPDLPTVRVRSGGGFAIQLAHGEVIRVPTGQVGIDRFLAIWLELHRPKNGYFSPDDIPFHAAETLIVEAPDHGHITTSETFSYWAWLEASFGAITGDYSLLDYAVERIETHMIPRYQPTVSAYSPQSPAQYAPEEDQPSAYPVRLDSAARAGRDPLAEELRRAHGEAMYGMHWLLDATNWYGFGAGQAPQMINTFERGPQESVWETVPHPSVENFAHGAPGSGFLSLFTSDGSGYKQQWRYTAAPDADARLIQAIYLATRQRVPKDQQERLSELAAKAAKMGDYLRYSFFDKYFKPIGCQSPRCEPAQDRESAHFLLSWYYAWGGSIPGDSGSWSWRIGASHVHFGYQNPLTAYALGFEPRFRPKSDRGAEDWRRSLDRQLEFYSWLQSEEGAIAGGATSSYRGRYESYPADSPTFHGMAYVPHPVYEDPPSNNWFGFQTWSMERLAAYFEVTGDPRAEPVLSRFCRWAVQESRLESGGGFQIPATLAWSGRPSTSTPRAPVLGTGTGGLHVRVVDRNQDVGIAASLARTFRTMSRGLKAHRSQQAPSQELARDLKGFADELLERLWQVSRDDQGLATAESRPDYRRFGDPVFVPPFMTGTMPFGGKIEAGASFLSLRPQYRNDPDFGRVDAYLKGGPVPVFRYHRFWTEVEAAMAYVDLPN